TLPVLGTIRSNPGYTLIGKLVVIVGVALLLQAWLRLGHTIRTRRVTNGHLLNRLAIWWGAPLALAPVLFSRDVFSDIALSRPLLARACGVDEAKAIWIGLLNPLIFLHFVSAAHNDALMVGLLIAGIALAMEKKPIPALVLVSLAGAVKAPALLGLPFVGIAW